MIKSLNENEIFVFGSNKAGIHGAGAAQQAHRDFEAEWGVGIGPTGQCYAIPTKDEYLKIMPIGAIHYHIDQFMDYTEKHPELTFLVTAIGCGLAKYTPKQIAPLFSKQLSNVILPKEFEPYVRY